MTHADALDIVAMLTAAYPSWRPSEATQRLYVEVLLPARADQVKRAVMEIIKSEREFAPPVGVICAAAARLDLSAAGARPLLPEEAWELVAEQIRHAGYYRQPKFNNPLIDRVVAAMDWHDICSNENVEATRAHFFRIFATFQKREVEDAAILGILPGPKETQRVDGTVTAQIEERKPTEEERERNKAAIQEVIRGIGVKEQPRDEPADPMKPRVDLPWENPCPACKAAGFGECHGPHVNGEWVVS